MDSADIIAYTLDGDSYCPNCASEMKAQFHACKESGSLFDPGWHNCGEIGQDGSPCHIELSEGEDACPVFADYEDEIIGWTCGTCGDCYTPGGWTPSDYAVKDYRWSCCPSCNSQRPYNNDSDIRLQALQGKLQCGNCLKPTHF